MSDTGKAHKPSHDFQLAPPVFLVDGARFVQCKNVLEIKEQTKKQHGKPETIPFLQSAPIPGSDIEYFSQFCVTRELRCKSRCLSSSLLVRCGFQSPRILPYLQCQVREGQAIENMPVFRMPMPPADMGHAWYKAHFFVQPDNLKQGWDRDRIMAEINDRGVPCQTGICPEVYLESAFDGHVARPASRLPVAQQLGEASLMLPVHPTLSAGNMDKMCEALILVGEMASQ